MSTIKAFIKRHPVLTYYVLTFAISWGGGLIVLGPDGFLGTRQLSEKQFLLGILAGITGPSAAGILLTGLVDGRAGFREFRSRLLNWRVGARWYAVALLTGPLLSMATLFALSLTSPVFLPGILVSDHKASLVLIGLAAGLVVGFLEEIGWTGFAIPRLRLRHGILTTGLILGLLWGVWHFPVFSGEASASGTLPMPLYLSVLLFSFLPPFRVLMVWVYDRTESLLVVMLMHAVLSATSMILQPQGTGVEVIIHDLLFAAVLWIFVGTVAAANGGQLSRHPLPRGVA
jgi:membrane protease YdiL (CAAX protease family)